ATTTPRSRGKGAGSATEEDLGLLVARERHGLELTGAVDQRHSHDVRATQLHHLAEVALVHRVDRVDAEPGGEHPIERGGRTAALDVAEHDRAGLLAGLL